MSENKKPLTIGIEFADNKTRTFHVNRLLSNRDHSFRFPTSQYGNDVLSSVGAVGQVILEQLDNIDGLVKINIFRHEMTLEKGKMFDWGDLVFQIVEVLASVFQSPEPQVVYTDSETPTAETKTE